MCTVDAMSGGTAQVAVNGQWQPIIKGAAVTSAARVRTGPDTRMHLSCDDGISVTIGTATDISLNGLVGMSGPDHTIGLHLFSGITGIVAPKRTWDKFEVATDVAIASVRSTEWLVESDKDGGAVFTRRGRVEVLAGGVLSSLGVGEGVTVSADAVAGPVKVWSAARVAKAGSALGYEWK
ncbi:MAG: FecR domain-containing protein [Cypionkella sp.]